MYKKFVKRIFDLVLVIMILPVVLPLLLLTSLAIALQDGFPVIFTQNRLGKNGRSFKIYKFRTMVKNAEQLGPLSTAPGDKRVTKIGAKLRNLSIDELPQIINIIRGNMSIVGPRPDIYTPYDELTDDEISRVCVMPGITGLAQVNGRSSLTKNQRMNYDLEYVKRCSFLLDVCILLKTVIKVMKKENVNSSLDKKRT